MDANPQDKPIQTLGRVFYVQPTVSRALITKVVLEDAAQTLNQKGLDWPIDLIINPEPMDEYTAMLANCPPGSISYGWRAKDPNHEWEGGLPEDYPGLIGGDPPRE